VRAVWAGTLAASKSAPVAIAAKTTFMSVNLQSSAYLICTEEGRLLQVWVLPASHKVSATLW
jgi:hypothetical protein